MPSYVVTGASRGIGLGFVDALSSKSGNVVFAIIRNAKTAGKLYDLSTSRSNIHVVLGEVTDPKQMEEAAKRVGQVTGGKLDVLINNAGAAGPGMTNAPSYYIGKAEEMRSDINEALNINFFSAMYTTNAFLPLIRQGKIKKIISVSSAMCDETVILTTEVPFAIGYAAAKAGLNSLMAKYAVELKSEGILVLSLSPGWVKTGAADEFNEQALDMMLQVFQKLDPNVKGMTTVEQSVQGQLSVIDRLTPKESGKFLSQHGNRNWF